MKKVICVEPTCLLTKDKEYNILEEDEAGYLIKTDQGEILWYPKSRFRPVPEQEYQYGQEVEFFDCGKYYNGKIVAVYENEAWIKYDNFNHVADFRSIRPVQSMRDRVLELITCGLHTADQTADKILELLNNKN